MIVIVIGAHTIPRNVNDTHTRAYSHLDEALDPEVPVQEREHVRAARAVLARCCHAGALPAAMPVLMPVRTCLSARLTTMSLRLEHTDGRLRQWESSSNFCTCC